jgi:AsmA protein
VNKPLKIALIAAGVLLAVLVGLAIALPLLFDPNDYRDEIAAKVKQETGRELKLGEVGLKVFPWLRASASGVVLGNAEGFGAEPFAEIGEADVGVKLFPLLFDRRAEVSTVTLKGLRLRMAVDANGRNNWSDLVKDQAEKEPEAEKKDKGFDPADLDISGVHIEDAAISYSDARSGKQYQIEKLRLETDSLRAGKPFDLDLGFSAQSAQPQAGADVELKGRVEHLPEKKTVSVQKLQLKLKGGGPQLAGGKAAKADLEVLGNVLADLAQQRVSVDDLQIKLKGSGLDLETDAQIRTKLVVDLANLVYQAQGFTLDGTVAGKAIPGGKQPIKLATDLRLDRKAGTLLLDKLQLQTAGLDLRSRISGEGLLEGQTPKLEGPISIAPFNPRPLLAQLGVKLETADPKALTQASLKASYRGGASSATFEDLDLQLDQSSVQGRFGIRDFKSKALEFGLKIDQLDADRYLPPKKAADGKNAGETKKGGSPDTPLPTDALQKLNANGHIDIAQLKLNGLKLSDVRLKLSGTPGGVQQQEVSAQLYGGRVVNTTRVSPGAKPGLAIKTQLTSLNAAPFLKDLIGKDRVSGLGNLTLDLQGRGNTVGELKRTLNGDIAFRVENGAVKGFNLAQIVRKGKAALAGNLAYQESAAEQTDFTVFAADAKVVNGVLHSEQLDAASPLFRVDGAGQVDLVNETINYLAKPTVVNTTKGQGGKDLEELAGITIPIKLTGNLYKPKVSLDIRAALEQKATEKFREKLADKEDELKAKLQDKIARKLGGDAAKPGQPASEDAVKQQLNDKLGDLLFGKKRKSEAAPQPAPAPAPEAPPQSAPTPSTAAETPKPASP